jgi:hypothetical protein
MPGGNCRRPKGDLGQAVGGITGVLRLIVRTNDCGELVSSFVLGVQTSSVAAWMFDVRCTLFEAGVDRLRTYCIVATRSQNDDSAVGELARGGRGDTAGQRGTPDSETAAQNHADRAKMGEMAAKIDGRARVSPFGCRTRQRPQLEGIEMV